MKRVPVWAYKMCINMAICSFSFYIFTSTYQFVVIQGFHHNHRLCNECDSMGTGGGGSNHTGIAWKYWGDILTYFWPLNIFTGVKQNLISLFQWLPLDHLDRQAATRHVEHLEADGETNINGALLQALKIVSQTQVWFDNNGDEDGFFTPAFSKVVLWPWIF